MGITSGATAKRSIMVTNGPAESSRPSNPASRIPHQTRAGGDRLADGSAETGKYAGADHAREADPEPQHLTGHEAPLDVPEPLAHPHEADQEEKHRQDQDSRLHQVFVRTEVTRGFTPRTQRLRLEFAGTPYQRRMPAAIASRRRILSSSGGWVLKRFPIVWPESGLTM